VRRQWWRAVVAVVAVGALVSGCGGGPNQAGSAVIVGSESVPLDTVQSRLDVALSRTETVSELEARGVQPADIARDVVTRAVLHDLLARTSELEGIVVSEGEVDAEIDAIGGQEIAVQSSLYDLPTLRERVRDQLVAIRLAERYVDRLAVTADIVALTSRAEAEEAARIVAAGGPAADAIFADNPETSRQGLEFRASTNPEAAATVLFGAPAGSTVAFQPSPEQSGWIVLRVVERRTDAPPVGADGAARIGEAELLAIGERLVQPLGDELGVRVNPRYGQWDPIPLRVVGAEQVSGVILPPPVLS
jgi:hypothetical protein